MIEKEIILKAIGFIRQKDQKQRILEFSLTVSHTIFVGFILNAVYNLFLNCMLFL